ncbi:MAG: T9SS type A sorting domain-containing protein, partial [Paludibacteraceae bacterium]|nr:T9SS type A sorting domain-containing protein [Paludibacteraceae bacterium]
SSSTYHEHMHKVTHYFGDPSMEIWTDVPTCLNPTITKEGSNIRVKTGNVSGCKVTICRISDLAILSTKKMSGTEELFNVGNAPCYVTITKHNYIPYIGVARDLYLQNMSFTEDRTVHGVNVTAGKNVTSDLSQGNVYVRSGKTTLLATSSLKLKTGFIVKSGAKFVGKKQARSCSYTGNGPRSLRSADIDLEYDDEEFIIDPEITDLDDAVSNANGIEIYPNPTDGMLYIRSNNTINKVIVTDLTGKVIMDVNGDSDEVELDLSSNAQGMYLLNVVTENDFYVEKVVLK